MTRHPIFDHHRILLLAGSALATTVLAATPALAGCASGDNPQSSLLSSHDCQAFATAALATAVGQGASAEYDSVALGAGAIAGGFGSNYAIAIGAGQPTGGVILGAFALGTGSIAIGEDADGSGNTSTLGYKSIAIGASAQGVGDGATMLGASAGMGSDPVGAFGNQNNTGIGFFSSSNVNGSFNTAAGSQAGQTVTGDGNSAFGAGAGSNVVGNANVALGGSGSGVIGDRNISVGISAGANVTGGSNIAIGEFSGGFISASNTVAIGNQALALHTSNMALGALAYSSGGGAVNGSQASIALGAGASAGGLSNNAFQNAGTTALGTGAQAGATGDGESEATAVGYNTKANAAAATSVGSSSQATAGFSTALGAGAQATAIGSVALGQGSIADQANTVSVGSVGNERKIVNVAAGTVSATSTDAVNGSQLYATNQMIASIGGDAGTALALGQNSVQYDDPSHANVTFNNGGAAVGLHNVADGVIGAGSADAVNGGQVFALQMQVANLPVAANNSSGLAAPSATGADSTATGYGAVASGDNATANGSGAVASGAGASAYGQGAQATFAGATAIGAGAVASADPTTAVGFQAQATGTNASAFGGNAVASGENSTAVGQGAQATQANSTAIGQGARTTRANQVAVGTASSTYTLAGVNSAASLSSQVGPTKFVTTDASGNLAASAFGTGDIAALDGRVGSLEQQVGGLAVFTQKARIEARQGVATALAMTSAPMPSSAGRTSWATNAATFRGQYAFGGSLAHRLDVSFPLAVTAGVSYGGDSNLGMRVGLQGEF